MILANANLWISAIGAAGAVIAAVFAAMNWFGPWLHRRDIADKLVFENIRVSLRVTPTDGILEGMGLGFDLRSHAEFPLEFTVTEMNTQIEDRVPLMSHTRTQWFDVPIRGFGFYNDHEISVDAPRDTTLGGKITATVIYRRPGRDETHTLTIDKRVTLTFNPDGTCRGWQWYDA